MKRILCILLMISLLLMPLAKAQCKFLETKTRGKLSLVILLTGIAIVTDLLVNSDRKDVDKLHAKLGPPDKTLEFRKGFDRFRIEWYGEEKYIFRNGMLWKRRVVEFETSSKDRKRESGKTRYDN